MAFSGSDIAFKVSGTAVAMEDEACTEVSGTVFQITDAAKRVIDPNASVTVNVDAAPETAYTLNRLTGTITFDSTQTGNTVTITTSYLPMSSVATAKDYKLSRKRNNGDITPFNKAYVVRQGLLWDVSGSLGRFQNADGVFEDALAAATADADALCIEASLDGSVYWRAWAKPAAVDDEGAADSFVEEMFEWEGTPDVDGRVIAHLQ